MRETSATERDERVLVVGCGYVGTPLAVQLAADGQAVWGVRRTGWQAPAGVCPCCADVSRPETLSALPSDIHVAIVLLATGGGESRHRELYVDGVGHLLAALRRSSPGLCRLVFVSSTGVYGDHAGQWVDEDTPTEPAIPAGEALVEAEARIQESPFPSVVVRFSGIYGPGRTRLIRSIQSGRATIEPGPPRYLNQIHLDDCVGALRHVVEVPSPPPVVIASDHEPAARGEVLGWIAERLGLPAPTEAAAADVVPGSLRGNKRCRNARLVRSGFVFRYPNYREGYAALLEDPRRPG